VPSTRIAESLGKTIVQNIVMVGFFAAVTKIVPPETMREAVRESVPPSTEDLNLAAFDAGYRYFEETYGQTGPARMASATAETSA
jgi:2-oxoglutarate ferredoxin oxidoreductase subunit gamma